MYIVGMPGWEYMLITRSRDAQYQDEQRYWFMGPGEEDPRELEVPGKDGSTFIDLLNRHGAAGWELVGPPTQAKVAMTYKNRNATYMDYADWASERYTFKREKP